VLRCSEWWIKEQARNRRIPYSRIAGGYRFTAEHIAEIVRLFEVRPIDDGGAAGVSGSLGRRRSLDREELEALPIRLHARPPRRARGGAGPKASAA
jgi:hypothetical protein